uniref:Zinc finger protein 750 n=1 Tax=Electrophorus electricus TaxID=8005 RepID=A0AAY5F582_ELEEL
METQERKPKKPHYIPRPPGKPFKYQCFQCPFTCNIKSHLFNHMKYDLCKNSISLVSQREEHSSRTSRAPLRPPPSGQAPARAATPTEPAAARPSQPVGEDSAEAQVDEAVSPGAGEGRSPAENVQETAPETAGVESAARGAERASSSAFSPVPRKCEGEVQKLVPRKGERAFHPVAGWAQGAAPTALRAPAADYPPYALAERLPHSLYQPYLQSPAGAPAYRLPLQEHHRPLVSAPLLPPSPSLLHPYYRYGPSFLPAAPLPYGLYPPPEQAPAIQGPRYLPVEMYTPAFDPRDYGGYSYLHPGAYARRPEGSQQPGGERALRQSPPAGCAASGSPNRPRTAEFARRAGQSDHVAPEREPITELEDSCKSSQSVKLSSMVTSSSFSSGEAEDEDSDDDNDEAAPLNLSKRAPRPVAAAGLESDRDVDDRSGLDSEGGTEEDDAPLDLRLRPQNGRRVQVASPAAQEPATVAGAAEREQRERRRSAAFALCQLASSSSSPTPNPAHAAWADTQAPGCRQRPPGPAQTAGPRAGNPEPDATPRGQKRVADGDADQGGKRWSTKEPARPQRRRTQNC